MADYLHGAYGQIQAVGTKVAAKSQNAIVYVGTAPVQTVEGGAKNVNKPILVSNIAEARKYLLYIITSLTNSDKYLSYRQ